MTRLLGAKLKPPRPASDTISRPHLVQRLNVASDVALTLISAPAGFGKTTLVAEWLATSALPTCWISLDENDNQVETFLAYFLAALESILPHACQETRQLLNVSKLPAPAVLARQLGNDIAELPHEFILILDDYHFITDSAALELMDELVRYQPPQLHLVMTTRVDPVLPLARLRARGQLAELRAADLMFSETETVAFFAKTQSASLAAEMLARIYADTEGWAAGLRLTALALHHRQAEASPFQMQNVRFVMDYLMQEVLARQAQEIQSFLLQTSFLDKFTPEMCDAILETNAGSSARLIQELNRANLFLVTLDENNSWYRYHHLFRDLLRQQHEREFERAHHLKLLMRASQWFAAHDFVSEAIRYALLGDNPTYAAEIVEAKMHAALNREDQNALARWLELLPADLLSQRPRVILARIYALNVRLQNAALEGLISDAAARMTTAPELAEPTARKIAEADLHNRRSVLYYAQGKFRDSIDAATHALVLHPREHMHARGVAQTMIGLAYQALGQTEVAIPLLNKAVDDDPTSSRLIARRALVALTLVHLVCGEMARVKHSAERLAQIATATNVPNSLGWAHCLLGIVHYEWNELPAAIQQFSLATQLRQTMNPRPAHEAMVGLALSYQASGLADQANQTAAELVEFDRTANHSEALLEAYALKARLALEQGDIEGAARQVPLLGTPPLAPFVAVTTPHLTEILLHLARGTQRDLSIAQTLLTRLLEHAKSLYHTRQLAQLLAWQAALWERQGMPEKADAAMERSLQLADAGGLIRTYLDLGSSAAPLLARLIGNGSPFAQRVAAAFTKHYQTASPMQPSNAPHSAALVEPLTGREMQVLELLARRFSDQEIAEQLVVSKSTAKTHVRHIFDKLGVNARRDAVDAARTLGILSPLYSPTISSSQSSF